MPLGPSSAGIFWGIDYAYSNASQFRGFMAEMRIWRVMRAESEIQDAQSSRLFSPASQIGLQAYYALPLASTKGQDSSGLSNTMTLFNATITAPGLGPDLNTLASPCNARCVSPATVDSCACRCVNPSGYSVRFDGISDYAVVYDSTLQLINDFTVGYVVICLLWMREC